eukprot:GHVU01179957.1.p1 GENE.GHVU01179957.1~~GHVU01179957.1.p1  ORF type:complete len:181 (+),score=24.56 GHVU01179957.1:175-717(+)
MHQDQGRLLLQEGRKSVGGLQEGKCCCIRNTATFKLEPPLDKQNVCVRASNRCCCMFCRDLCKCVPAAGEAGLCADATRLLCCVNSCKIPPTNIFLECCTIRLMGPKEKNRDVYSNAPGAVVSSANFGLDTEDDVNLPAALMMNHAYHRVADAIWDMVPDDTAFKSSKVAAEEIPMSLKM